MVIGISGKLGSGKDLAADLIKTLIQENSNRKVFKHDFAKPLKRVVAEIVGCHWNKLYSREGKLEALPEGLQTASMKTYRDMLQQVGSAFKTIDPDFFVKALFNNFEADAKLGVVIVTDVRFPNELESIQRVGGKVIRLRSEVSEERHDWMHESETALDKAEILESFDAIVDNSRKGREALSPSDSRDAFKHRIEQALKQLNII